MEIINFAFSETESRSTISSTEDTSSTADSSFDISSLSSCTTSVTEASDDGIDAGENQSVEADFRPSVGVHNVHKQYVELSGWEARLLLSKPATQRPPATAILQKNCRQSLVCSRSTHAPQRKFKRDTESGDCFVMPLICVLSPIKSFIAANRVPSVYNKTDHRYLAVVNMPTDDINTQQNRRVAP